MPDETTELNSGIMQNALEAIGTFQTRRKTKRRDERRACRHGCEIIDDTTTTTIDNAVSRAKWQTARAGCRVCQESRFARAPNAAVRSTPNRDASFTRSMIMRINCAAQ